MRHENNDKGKKDCLWKTTYYWSEKRSYECRVIRDHIKKHENN